MMNRRVGHVALAFLFTAVLSACPEAKIPEAQQEVAADTNVKLDLPAVPTFTMPKPNADGTHAVREMRLKGQKHVDQDVQIKGYVIWKYDCAQAVRQPEMDDKAVAAFLEEHPERCEIPNFKIGDTADTPINRGVWVVEVPRHPRKDEIKAKRYTKEELKNWPEVPEYNIGDEVLLDGKWALRSPKGFANSDGLLVYAKLTHVGVPVEEAPAQ